MPNIKRTDAECDPFAKIEALVISKDYRGKGFGKMLLQYAIDNIKQLFYTIKCIKIDVNSNNEIAKKLYESQGFELSPVQNPSSNIMNVLEYVKNL
ncbi:GNAT family N-acetyltransferase [Candidatus Dependentiae bacterium]|nr:GNAT family N-acetyltransferase [Candidatus Dependentiae bacterium]